MSSSEGSGDDGGGGGPRVAFRVTSDDEEFERNTGFYGAPLPPALCLVCVRVCMCACVGVGGRWWDA
jgi:hypothetical protein